MMRLRGRKLCLVKQPRHTHMTLLGVALTPFVMTMGEVVNEEQD
jgi:hypothetical protein